jgi:TnpA family transposase
VSIDDGGFLAEREVQRRERVIVAFTLDHYRRRSSVLFDVEHCLGYRPM